MSYYREKYISYKKSFTGLMKKSIHTNGFSYRFDMIITLLTLLS